MSLRGRSDAGNDDYSEAFSYSVSHDLRAPLRVVDGFGRILLDKHGAKVDEEGRQYLDRVRGGAQKLASLIEDLLGLSRIARAPLKKEPIVLAGMAIAQRIITRHGGRIWAESDVGKGTAIFFTLRSAA
jgi:signal transduction histidine kinase